MKIILIIISVILIINILFFGVLYFTNRDRPMRKISDKEYKEFQEWINNLEQKKKNERDLFGRRNG